MIAISHRMLASRQQVLVEGRSRKDPDELAGRTSNNRMVNFVGPERLIGQMVNIEIQAAMTHSLRGKVAATDPI